MRKYIKYLFTASMLLMFTAGCSEDANIEAIDTRDYSKGDGSEDFLPSELKFTVTKPTEGDIPFEWKIGSRITLYGSDDTRLSDAVCDAVDIESGDATFATPDYITLEDDVTYTAVYPSSQQKTLKGRYDEEMSNLANQTQSEGIQYVMTDEFTYNELGSESVKMVHQIAYLDIEFVPELPDTPSKPEVMTFVDGEESYSLACDNETSNDDYIIAIRLNEGTSERNLTYKVETDHLTSPVTIVEVTLSNQEYESGKKYDYTLNEEIKEIVPLNISLPSESGISFDWIDGDKMSLYDNTGKFIANVDYSAPNPDINGASIFFIPDGVELISSEDYTVVYPASSTEVNKDVYLATLANRFGSVVKDASVMSGTFTFDDTDNASNEIALAHDAAVLELTFESSQKSIPTAVEVKIDDSIVSTFAPTGLTAADSYKFYISVMDKVVDAGATYKFDATVKTNYPIDGSNIQTLSESAAIGGIAKGQIFAKTVTENITKLPNFDIDSPEDLLIFMADPTMAEKITLVANIDMAGKDWTPIEDFTGEFDGDNKTISNLTIEKDGVDGVGMFKQVSYGGKIHDLTLKDPKVSGKNQVGAIVGGMSVNNTMAKTDMQITNCHIIGGSITGGGIRIGGIVGHAAGGSISGCSVDGVTITSIPDATGCMAGGIIGDMRAVGCIQGCYAINTTITASPRSGGIVGFTFVTSDGSKITVAGCYSDMTTTDIGGIVGTSTRGKSGTMNFVGCYALDNSIAGTSTASTDIIYDGTFYTGSNEGAAGTGTAIEESELNSKVDAMNSAIDTRLGEDALYHFASDSGGVSILLL